MKAKSYINGSGDDLNQQNKKVNGNLGNMMMISLPCIMKMKTFPHLQKYKYLYDLIPSTLNQNHFICLLFSENSHSFTFHGKKLLTACSRVVSCYIVTIIDGIDGYYVLEHDAIGEWFITSLCITVLISNTYCTFDEVILGLCTGIVHSAIYRTPITYGKSP